MSQALTPEDLESAEFHVTVRGYARDEVHEVLNAAAKLIRDLQQKVETGYLNLGERMGELLQEAKDGAEELLASAAAAADRTIEEANAVSARTEEEARTRSADILQTAENHAAKIVREAEERVAELRAIEGEISGALKSLRTRLEGVAEGFLGREPVDIDPNIAPS